MLELKSEMFTKFKDSEFKQTYAISGGTDHGDPKYATKNSFGCNCRKTYYDTTYEDGFNEETSKTQDSLPDTSID